MPTQVVPLEGIDKIGWIADSPAVTLPPGAWSDVQNVRFDDGAIRRMFGEQPFMSNFELTDIQHVAYWENPNVRCYVVVNREVDGDHVYLVVPNPSAVTSLFNNILITDVSPFLRNEDGTESTTRNPFSISDNWTSTQFNGGYSIIINNGIEAPHHFTVRLGGSSSITSQINSAGTRTFEPLPGWDSYASGSYVSNFLSVSAGVLVTYGNLLVAGRLTERSLPQLPAITSGRLVPIRADIGDPNSEIVSVRLEATFAQVPSVVVGDRISIAGDPNYTFRYVRAGDGSLINLAQEVEVTVASPYNREYTVRGVNGMSLTLEPVGEAFPLVLESQLDLGIFNPDMYAMPSDLNNEPVPANTPTVIPDIATLQPPFGRGAAPSGDITSYHTRLMNNDTPATEIVRDLSGVVRTSSVAAPGAIPENWNPFATGAGTADEINLADAGTITAIRELRGNLFVFTSDTITQLRVQPTGLAAVPITKQYGALTQGGVFGFQGTLLVIGSDDIYIFAGNPGDIKSIADGRVRRYFYDDLHSTAFRNINIIRNQLYDELWIGYPSRSSVDGSLDFALVWSYTSNTWTKRVLPSVRSLTTGPVTGAGGSQYQLIRVPDTAACYEYTITNDQGQVNNRRLNALVTPTQIATGLTTILNGQAGFTARQGTFTQGTGDEDDSFVSTPGRGTHVQVFSTPVSETPWTLDIIFRDNAEIVVPHAITNEVEPQDPERPWALSVLNEARNYPVMAIARALFVGEVGTTFQGSDNRNIQRANHTYIRREALQFAPSKDTELLAGVYMNAYDLSPEPVSGQPENANLKVIIHRRDRAGQPQQTEQANPQTIFNIIDDYKVDVRVTSRMIDLEIASDLPTDDSPILPSIPHDWVIASIDLEIGKGGTR